MAFIPNEVINEIRDKTDIVDVISEYVQLTKRGNNYMASCPFHEDRNPSMSVSQDKQIYKCFSCGRGGNVFGFIQEMDGLSFVEAVAKVATMNNLSIDPQYLSAGTDRVNPHQKLYDIYQTTMGFYHYYLVNTVGGQEALDYLIQRGITQESLADFQLGMAPANSQALVDYLKEAGYTQLELEESQIVYLSESGQWIDRFRGRIIFPLRDSQGRTVAFSGRIFSQQASVGNQSAKYINSPESPIFDKSKLLYNLDRARPRIRQTNQALVAEGYMDVIALSQAGFTNVVATMGTSLTGNHLQTLAKIAHEIIFSFDGDKAGQEASRRAFELAVKHPGPTYKTVRIPNQLDPDAYIKERGSDSFQGLINQAQTSFEFNRDWLKRSYNLSNASELAMYIEAVVQEIGRIDSAIERELRTQELIQEFDLNADLIKDQVSLARAQHSQAIQSHQANGQADNYQDDWRPDQVSTQELSWQNQLTEHLEIRSQRAFQSEKLLLFNLIYHQEAWDYLKIYQENHDDIVMFHPISQKTYITLQQCYYEIGYPLPMLEIIDTIQDNQVNNFLTTILMDCDPLDYSQQVIEDCLRVIYEEFVQQEINELRAKAQEYRLQERLVDLKEILTEIMKLTRQIDQSKKGAMS